MDDISASISKLLGDEETLQQISRLKDLLLSDDTADNSQTPPNKETVSKNNDTINQLMKFLPLIANSEKEDDTTRLLNALRPFLSEERCARLDKAIKILHMMKLLPLLKEIRF